MTANQCDGADRRKRSCKTNEPRPTKNASYFRQEVARAKRTPTDLAAGLPSAEAP